MFDTSLNIGTLSPEIIDRNNEITSYGYVININPDHLLNAIDREILSPDEYKYFKDM